MGSTATCRKTVVAACTLQQDRVKKKILDDVDEICSRPQLGADVIVVFTEKSIPVGVQNELRTWVANEHEVVLHVLDGNAVADLLAAHDLNWLADRYLDLPAEASPVPLLTRMTPGTSSSASSGPTPHRARPGRCRRPPPVVAPCLPARLYRRPRSLARPALEGLETGPSIDLRRSVIYEIAIGHLRGHTDIRPARDHLEWFFSTVAEVKPSGALEDAEVLLTFCWGSIGLGVRGIPPEVVTRWRDQLIAHVDAEIHATANSARLYTLLLVRGALEFLQIPPPPFADMRRWWDQGSR